MNQPNKCGLHISLQLLMQTITPYTLSLWSEVAPKSGSIHFGTHANTDENRCGIYKTCTLELKIKRQRRRSKTSEMTMKKDNYWPTKQETKNGGVGIKYRTERDRKRNILINSVMFLTFRVQI
ncbi:hypothetical protein BLOT_011518 [Blomia tropicalis]|nr:hypothetical protein BLOT_011518 [Blomia tropicalis]